MTAIEAIAELEKTRRGSLDIAKLRDIGFAEHAVALLAKIGPQEIAADFIVPRMLDILVNNRRVLLLPSGSLCFGESAGGGLWVVDRETSNRVGFIDPELEIGAHVQHLEIELAQWPRLAIYMRDYDLRWNPLAGAANRQNQHNEGRAFLDSLSAGLSKRYPHKLAW